MRSTVFLSSDRRCARGSIALSWRRRLKHDAFELLRHITQSESDGNAGGKCKCLEKMRLRAPPRFELVDVVRGFGCPVDPTFNQWLLRVESLPDVIGFFATLQSPVTPLLPSFLAGETLFASLVGGRDFLHAAGLWTTAGALTDPQHGQRAVVFCGFQHIAGRA